MPVVKELIGPIKAHKEACDPFWKEAGHGVWMKLRDAVNDNSAPKLHIPAVELPGFVSELHRATRGDCGWLGAVLDCNTAEMDWTELLHTALRDTKLFAVNNANYLPSLVRGLLEIGIDFSQPDREGTPVCVLAVRSAVPETLQLLAAAGAPVEAKDRRRCVSQSSRDQPIIARDASCSGKPFHWGLLFAESSLCRGAPVAAR